MTWFHLKRNPMPSTNPMLKLLNAFAWSYGVIGTYDLMVYLTEASDGLVHRYAVGQWYVLMVLAPLVLAAPIATPILRSLRGMTRFQSNHASAIAMSVGNQAHNHVRNDLQHAGEYQP